MNIVTPPMGWNTWNTFGPSINETLIMEAADAMAASGLKDAGYEYIVIDDCWSLKERNEKGELVPDPVKFPHGMKYIADYIHSKGLKFGMYSCAGFLTCAGYPASYGYEWIDAKTFASWEIDYLKYDFCFRDKMMPGSVLYRRMGAALANCGRDILFSACSWGSENTQQWINTTGADIWRSTGDINDSWGSVKALSQSQITVQEYNKKGCFNDMDMLIVGMHGKGNVGLGGCTFEEYKLHFSLWALLGSPLMIGCDIRSMDEETRAILMNKEVLAVNQDPACREVFFANLERPDIRESRKPEEPFYTNCPIDTPVLARLLDNGDYAVGIFNFMDTDANVWHYAFNLNTLGISLESGKTLEFTDLWSGEKLLPFNHMFYYDTAIPAHACRLFRARVVDKK